MSKIVYGKGKEIMKYKLKLNLQMFNDEEQEGQEAEVEAITFGSRSELDSYLDKHTSKALNTARSNWEQEAQAKIEEAKTEAEKMAKMSADEKAKAEAEKRANELARREADITRRELKAQALEQLAEKGLPKDLVGAISFVDAEACNKSIESIENAFNQALEARMKQELINSAVVPGSASSGSKSNNPFAKDSFNLTEQGKIIKEDPERAKLLMQQAR